MSHLNVNHKTSGMKDLRHQSLFFTFDSKMDMKHKYYSYAQNSFYGISKVGGKFVLCTKSNHRYLDTGKK